MLATHRWQHPLRLGILIAASTVVVLAASLGAPPLGAVSAADPGEPLFQSKCAACHTIGGGPLVGPDLKGVSAKRDRAWLIGMITTPDQLLARNDPIAKDLARTFPVPMPNLGIAKADAEALLAYIDARSSGAAGPVGTSQPAIAGDPDIGRAYFAGTRAFAAGGPACATCHAVDGPTGVAGGSLGPNLTQLHARLGDAATGAALAGLPFPTMLPIYGNRQLAPEEQAHLLAYLRASAGAGSVAPPAEIERYGVPAVIGAVLLFAVAHVLWRQRLRGVHQPFVRRYTRS